MTKINSTLALFLIICLHSFSQNNKEIFSDEKNIKHQIGIGINKFVNSAFASDKNAYSINYRYKYNTKISLRSGAIYEKDDSENGFTDIGLKLGIDKKIRQYNKWSIYYGLDIISNYSNYKNVNKDIYVIGGLSFIGIQYNLSKNFSFCIEPCIYIRHNIVIDNSTFLKNNRTTWTESGIGKLGYINLNFHF